jgi:DNA-binding LacI/PurR family transcriptional regulator
MLVNDPLIEERRSERKRSFITIGRHPANDQIDYVDADNRAGAYQGIMHILRTGHRRVGVINGPGNPIRQPTQRMSNIAAEMLVDKIEHPESLPCRVVLPTERVIHSSG